MNTATSRGRENKATNRKKNRSNIKRGKKKENNLHAKNKNTHTPKELREYTILGDDDSIRTHTYKWPKRPNHALEFRSFGRKKKRNTHPFKCSFVRLRRINKSVFSISLCIAPLASRTCCLLSNVFFFAFLYTHTLTKLPFLSKTNKQTNVVSSNFLLL